MVYACSASSLSVRKLQSWLSLLVLGVCALPLPHRAWDTPGPFWASAQRPLGASVVTFGSDSLLFLSRAVADGLWAKRDCLHLWCSVPLGNLLRISAHRGPEEGFYGSGGACISLIKSPCSGGSQSPYPHEKRGPKELFQTFFLQGHPLSTSPRAMGWLHGWNQICHCCWLFNLNLPLLHSPFLFCLCVLVLSDQNILSALVVTFPLCQGSAYPPL